MILKKGQIIGERYEILDILGKGGMAIVYKAKDTKLERVVTLKVLREEYNKDDEFIRRFSIEAKAAAKLNHPNIVSVYDVGVTDNINYIVMEYIEGANLKEVIRTRGYFTNEEALGVAIQISEALEEAHKNGIIHRDIKPQNILVTVKGEIKVTDFGIARAVNANTITSNNSTMGSVHYFSPEQARGGFIDQKSDIYSLGISMFEMVTGKLPYDDDTVVAIALKHINEDLPDIKQLNSEANDSVIKIIKKSTEKVSTNRYENIHMMTLDLKRALTKLNNPEVIIDDDFDIEKETTNTIVIDEDDLESIRNKAMTAFYNDEDFEELNNYIAADKKQKQKEKEKDSKLMVFFGALLALLIAILCFFFIIRSFENDKAEKVDVPNLVGLTLGDARSEAAKVGVTVEEVNQRFDDDIPMGDIIEQDYQEGDVLFEGGTIQVVTSLGTDKIEIPNLVGNTVNEVYSEMDNIPFELEEVYDYNDDVDINRIFKQYPEAGAMGEQGDTITIYISRGEEMSQVTVPNLVGMTESAAKSRIASSGLSYGGSTTTYSSSVEEGRVINQTVTAGSQALEGATISIVVSKGPKPSDVVEPTEDPDGDNTSTENPDIENPDTENPTGDTGTTEDNGDETTEEPQETTRILTLNPVLPDGADEVDVKIIALTSANSGDVIYNKRISKSQLPLEIPVSGTGVVRYALYVDGDLVGEEPIDFGEGVN